MKRAVLVVAVVALGLTVLGVVAHAQQMANLTGSWDLTQPGRGGTPQMMTLTIDQKGAAITGTLKGGQGDPQPLTGTVTGNDFTFTVTRQGRNGAVMVDYKGTLAAGALKGTVMQGQNTVDWSATKSKS